MLLSGVCCSFAAVVHYNLSASSPSSRVVAQQAALNGRWLLVLVALVHVQAVAITHLPRLPVLA